MNTATLEKAFDKIGAPLKIVETAGRRWRAQTSLTIDVLDENRRKGWAECFEIAVPLDHDDILAQVLDVQPKARHLVLQVVTPSARPGTRANVERFLCGHDERHWFAAPLKDAVTTVAQAMDSLKPSEILNLERKLGVTKARRNKHRNKAFTRQGEWFFVPAPEFDPGKFGIILKDEPISRGRGSKPHLCEELVRHGGSHVWVHNRLAPNGVSYETMMELKGRTNDRLSEMGWRNMVADAAVYVRGRVTHSDHATVTLQGWHKVIMSSEAASANLRFLD